MSDTDRSYRPGLFFLSRHANLNIPLIDPKFYNNPNGPREMLRPQITADFGEGSGNRMFGQDVTRDPETGRELPRFELTGLENAASFAGSLAEIRGGVLDFDDFANRHELSDEERDYAARRMLTLAADPKTPEVTLYQRPTPTAPVPNYDEIHHLQIVNTMASVGLLVEGLQYELFGRAAGPRDGIVEQYKKRLEDQQTEEQRDEALTAA